MFVDHYKTLGITRFAEPRTVEKAYRRCVRKAHPDVNKSVDALKHFYDIQRAYEVLRDPQQRRDYDRSLPQNHPMTTERERPRPESREFIHAPQIPTPNRPREAFAWVVVQGLLVSLNVALALIFVVLVMRIVKTPSATTRSYSQPPPLKTMPASSPWPMLDQPRARSPFDQ